MPVLTKPCNKARWLPRRHWNCSTAWKGWTWISCVAAGAVPTFPPIIAMDGLLERYGWYGKEFVDADHVHPLVFNGIGGKRYTVNPSLMPIGLAHHVPDVLNSLAGRIFPWLKPVFGTRRTAARLRLTSFRGKVSTAMIYDRQPIQDIFRRVDADTVLGVMDFKGMSQPYFFVLRRDTQA
jgi:hypothetical protein